MLNRDQQLTMSVWGRVRHGLDGLSAVATLVTSLALIYAAIAVRARATEVRSSAIYQVGDSFGEIPGIRFQDSRLTLVMFVRSGCKFCTASAPFYGRLLAMKDRARVVAIGYEDTATLKSYLDSLNVRPDLVAKAVPGLVRLTGTPALVLVSSGGKVDRVWRGQLDSAGERSVIESVVK
ncbi:MAG: hypothetical protein WCJ42_12520 [Actinomycetes bacterium]